MATSDPYNDSFHDELYDLAMSMAAYFAAGVVSRVPYVGPVLGAAVGMQASGEFRDALGNFYTEATTDWSDNPVMIMAGGNLLPFYKIGIDFYP